MIVPFSCES